MVDFFLSDNYKTCSIGKILPGKPVFFLLFNLTSGRILALTQPIKVLILTLINWFWKGSEKGSFEKRRSPDQKGARKL